MNINLYQLKHSGKVCSSILMMILVITSGFGKDEDKTDTPDNTPTQHTLVVDGVSWTKKDAGCGTTPSYYVYFSGNEGMFRIFFTEPPASGTYYTNWSTALQSGQCKLLLEQLAGNKYYSADGETIYVTNTNGKVRVQFPNMNVKEEPPGTSSKTVNGSFGCDF